MRCKAVTWLVAGVALLSGALLFYAPTRAQTNTITVEKPFSRATPGGATIAAGYMTIVNRGGDDKLVAATSPASGKVEIHEMAMQGTVMRMRQVPGGLPVAGGKTLALAPGGNHLMLMELKAPLKQGDKVPVTLQFEKAGKVDVTLDVQAIGGAPASGHRH